MKTNLFLRGNLPKSGPMFSWKSSRCSRQGFLEGKTQKCIELSLTTFISIAYNLASPELAKTARHANPAQPSSNPKRAFGCAKTLANAIKTMVLKHPPRPQNTPSQHLTSPKRRRCAFTEVGQQRPASGPREDRE